MRTWLAAGALAVAGLLAAGCSSGHPRTPVALTPAGAGAGGAGGKIAYLINYAGCMRTHGVPGFPEPSAARTGGTAPAAPSGSTVNRNSPQYRRAAQTCRSLLPNPAGAQPITAEDQVDYLKAAQCMRTHGVPDFPDPVFANGGVHLPPPPPGLDTHSRQVLRAEATCRRLIPSGLPYSR